MVRFHSITNTVNRTQINASTDEPTQENFYRLGIQIKEKIEADLDGSGMVFSDTFSWQGTRSDSRNFGFIMRYGDHEWFFVIPMGTSFGARIPYAFENINDFFVSSEGGTLSSGPGTWAIHYNCKKGAYGIPFDDPSTMTFHSHDIDGKHKKNVATVAAMTSAIPTGSLKGVASQLVRNSITSLGMLVFDTELDCLMMCYGHYWKPEFRTVIVMGGGFIEPADIADQETASVIHLSLKEGSGTSTSDPDHRGHNIEYSSCYNPATGEPDYGASLVYPSDAKDIFNWLTEDGKIAYSQVEMLASDSTKGLISTDLFRAGGMKEAWGMGAAMQSPIGPMVKLTRHFYVAWPQGLSPFVGFYELPSLFKTLSS